MQCESKERTDLNNLLEIINIELLDPLWGKKVEFGDAQVNDHPRVIAEKIVRTLNSAIAMKPKDARGNI